MTAMSQVEVNSDRYLLSRGLERPRVIFFLTNHPYIWCNAINKYIQFAVWFRQMPDKREVRCKSVATIITVTVGILAGLCNG